MKEVSMVDERTLLEKVSLGDRIAYATLYSRYLPKLYRFIFPFTNQSKEETEEVLQEVFLKVWIRKESLINMQSFEAYIFKMAKNQLIDSRKRIESRKNTVLKLIPHTEPQQTSAFDNLVYAEYVKAANQAVYNLTPQRKKIFVMRTQDEMPIDKIATTLDISKSAVKKQLYEAISSIKDHLKRYSSWPY